VAAIPTYCKTPCSRRSAQVCSPLRLRYAAFPWLVLPVLLRMACGPDGGNGWQQLPFAVIALLWFSFSPSIREQPRCKPAGRASYLLLYSPIRLRFSPSFSSSALYLVTIGGQEYPGLCCAGTGRLLQSTANPDRKTGTLSALRFARSGRSLQHVAITGSDDGWR